MGTPPRSGPSATQQPDTPPFLSVERSWSPPRGETASPIARALALAPGATNDPQAAVRLAAQAVKQAPRVAWWIYVQGVAEYRAGRPNAAIARLHEALAADPGWASSVLIRPVLAMAYHRAGRPIDAKTWLDRARQTSGAFGSSAPWWDRVEFRLLLREAEAMLGRGPGRP